jgi:hypothetical protein
MILKEELILWIRTVVSRLCSRKFDGGVYIHAHTPVRVCTFARR